MEDHLQGQPVGEPADEQAEQRHDYRKFEEDPDRHLHDADHRAEVQPGPGDELELLVARLLEDAVEQFLVLDQTSDNHVLEVATSLVR
jgi:hypothetical protein